MNVIEGLNKVDCYYNDSTYNGCAVEVTNGSMTWSGILSSGHVILMIPNIPAPAKKTYTVKLHSSSSLESSVVYQNTFELGFGDSIKLPLFWGDLPAQNSQIYETNVNVSRLREELNYKITYGQSDLADGSSTLATGTLYCYY